MVKISIFENMSLITINVHADLDEIDKKLNKIISNQTFIINNMSKKTDFDALTARLDASHTAISESLTNLADDVRRLTEGMTPTGGLSEAEATEVFAALESKAAQIEAVATQIRELADQTTDPEPTPEP